MASTARVLWLIKGLGPGGAERLLVSSAPHVDAEQFEVSVCYLLPWKDQLAEELRAGGTQVDSLSIRNEWDVSWIGKLRRLMSERKIELVHAHLPYAGVGARLAARSLGGRARPAIVYTEHNTWDRYVPATRIMNRATFAMNDASIAVSESVARSIGPRPGLRVIPNGIDADALRRDALSREDARRELGLPEDVPVVGTVGGLTAKKGHEDLVRAAREVVDRFPNAVFVAIGLPIDPAPIESAIASLGLQRNVVLAGYRPSASRLMRAFDVFALPSLFEGMPLSLLEAMALGLPVVSTVAGGVPEVIGDGDDGILVPVRDSARLAAALSELLGDPDRRESLGKSASVRAEAFGIAEMVRRTEYVYREALGQRG
ncbi:MAG: glycosyltransferase [Actinomycetota bacterium]